MVLHTGQRSLAVDFQWNGKNGEAVEVYLDNHSYR
jgi:hypothetical protein